MYTRSLNARLKRLMGILLPMAGILIIVTLAGLEYWWEMHGRQQVFYKDVATFKKDVKRGDIIKPEMLTSIKIEKDKLIPNSIIDSSTILGLEAKQYIPRKGQLDPQFFEIPEIVTGQDKMNFKVPSDWIFSMPNSLRRKDHIAFYEVTAAALKTYEPKKINLDPNVNPNSSVPQVTKPEEPPVFNVVSGQALFKTVASYVKDSANREVVSMSAVDRLDGSSIIKDLEIVGSVADLKLLQEAVQRGSRFIIMYSDVEGSANGTKSN